MAALSRLQARIKENFHETTRDISLLTTGSTSSSAKYFDTATSDEKIKEISKLLDSRIEQEKLEGMKRIIAGMSKGRDMESFFAVVVKNVGSTSIEIKKLVYIYLLRFASTNSDLLLLSINTFQKDLSDSSPLIRSMSLRVLTSIRVPVIQGIVMLGLKKLVNDRNPWVRKTVAGGLAKVYSIDPSSLNQLIPLLQSLLSSHSPLTLGATLNAFLVICPDQLDLLHPYYRHICRLLVDADEWGQVVALQLLTRYARTMLEKPEGAGSTPPPRAQSSTKADPKQDESDDEFAGIDLDLAMLLHCSKPLFQSRNPAVVLGTAIMYYHLAPSGHASIGQENLVSPLLKLASTAEDESALMAWQVIGAIVEERPWLFADRFSSFFLHSSESSQVQIAKLKALATLVSATNVKAFLRECKQYTRFPNDQVAEEAVRAIGHGIQTQQEAKTAGLNLLMKLLKSPRDALVAQAVIALKSVILALPASTFSTETGTNPRRLVARLAKGLDAITHARARASVFWLVGQFAASEETAEGGLGWDGVAPWVPDVLRKGVKGFTEESEIVKLQILTLAAKVLALCPSTAKLQLLSQYLFMLARYDASYDVRDRSRFLHALLRGVRAEQKSLKAESSTDESEEDEDDDLGGVILRREQVRLVLLDRPNTAKEVSAAGTSEYEVGSMSRIIHKKLSGYEPVPEWTDDPTDYSLRESQVEHNKPVPSSFANHPPTPVQPAANHKEVSGGAQPPPVPIPQHLSSSFASITRSSTNSSPSGSLPMHTSTRGAKFKDLDKFLDSESETEEDEDEDNDSEDDR
ncbi:adaptin N terminal region-domain-containing protein [Kockovaella imperatae]|uniref:Adaptin N terminal region-domain-containing protein n=1 Tax=Kockovaella imperatae TaxID=4999 RepID=A0A1Y1U6V0_9TREE|nr:adaptin N terminal region-domain-containing protein [Kockovaella imperatae]ORX33246.1 adaptin N terminal region-domain-containing protein [Kockovaella imperatae]